MRRLVAGLLALAACGRIGFGERPTDAVPDVPGGHDEDGDGLADAFDPCPFVAGTDADVDDDGVGDDCDPSSTTDHTLDLFSPLTPGTSPFDNITGWTQDPDGISIAVDSALRITRPVANARVQIGFVIHALVGSGQHQLAVGVESPGVFYFVELNENLPKRNVSVVSFDSTNGYIDLGMVMHAGMHAGTGILRMDATASPAVARAFGVRAGWIGELYDAAGSTPQYTGGSSLRWAINGVDVTITYVAIITSP
jgi:hypothetical protein